MHELLSVLMDTTAPTPPDLTASLAAAQTNILSYVGQALPYALAVLGITVGIPVGIRIFRRFAK